MGKKTSPVKGAFKAIKAKFNESLTADQTIAKLSSKIIKKIKNASAGTANKYTRASVKNVKDRDITVSVETDADQIIITTTITNIQDPDNSVTADDNDDE